MNTQQAYERIRAYLTRPGATRAAIGGQCYYTIDLTDGTVHHCAVGCLLSDEVSAIVGGYEGTLQDLLDEFEFVRTELELVDLDFLRAAQEIHDIETSWGEDGFRVDRLDSLAQIHGLEVPA